MWQILQVSLSQVLYGARVIVVPLGRVDHLKVEKYTSMLIRTEARNKS